MNKYIEYIKYNKYILIQLIYIVLLIFTGNLFLDSYNNMDKIINDGAYVNTNTIALGQFQLEDIIEQPYVTKEDLIAWKVQLFQTIMALMVFIFIFILLVKPFWDGLPKMIKDIQERNKNA